MGYLDETLLRTLTTIRSITDDNQLNDAEKVEGIRTLLNTHETSVSNDGVKRYCQKLCMRSGRILLK